MTPTDLLPLPLRAWAAERTKVGGRGPAARCPDAPPTPAPPPHSRPLRNGNPAGNPNLAPRCGAKNRAGCPCRAPAMANGRCRQHGGKSTGPRTPKGIARMFTANTKHGRQSAPKRTQQLYVTTATRRGRLTAAARRLQPYLPKQMEARLAAGPPELWPPVHPTNLPFVQNPEPTPAHESPARLPPDAHSARNAARPLPQGLAAERHAARAEAASLAPWREAIAVARATKRAALAAKRSARAAGHAALAAKRTARQAKQTASAAKRTATRTTRVPAVPVTRPPVLDQLPDQYGLLQRELAARKAGLRVRISEPDHHPATNAPKLNSMFSRIYPMNPGTAAALATKSNSSFSRIYPMNPGTTAPTPNPNSAFPRIHPMNPDSAARAPKSNSAFPRIHPMNPGTTAAPSQPTHPTPTNAEALRTTTSANTRDSTLRATLEQQFGPAPPRPGWSAPQAWPPPPGAQRRQHSRRDPLAAFLGLPRHATART